MRALAGKLDKEAPSDGLLTSTGLVELVFHAPLSLVPSLVIVRKRLELPPPKSLQLSPLLVLGLLPLLVPKTTQLTPPMNRGFGSGNPNEPKPKNPTCLLESAVAGRRYGLPARSELHDNDVPSFRPVLRLPIPTDLGRFSLTRAAVGDVDGRLPQIPNPDAPRLTGRLCGDWCCNFSVETEEFKSSGEIVFSSYPCLGLEEISF